VEVTIIIRSESAERSNTSKIPPSSSSSIVMTRSAHSYTSLHKDDDDTLATAASVALIPPTCSSSISPDHQLSWNDQYFHDTNDDDDIVAVFDYDYDKMEEYNTSVAWLWYGLSCLYPPIGIAATLLGCAPCYLRQNVSWSARAQHVAVTRDGVRHVTDRHPSCCGLPCSDRGKVSKTVPFDKITDCDVHEPAGNTCCCIPNILYTVNIDTASSGGDKGGRELKLSGLQDPYALKKLVWNMKRQQQSVGGTTTAATTSTTMDRGGVAQHERDASIASPPSGGIVKILLQIRAELRSNNQLLKEMKDDHHQDGSAAAAAACDTELSALTEVTSAEFA